MCTCKDFDCPNHPSNHDMGCTLCIKKNLREHEIPSCFFNQIKGNQINCNGYHYEDFAKLVMMNTSDNQNDIGI